jgi:hypothetical protein
LAEISKMESETTWQNESLHCRNVSQLISGFRDEDWNIKKIRPIRHCQQTPSYDNSSPFLARRAENEFFSLIFHIVAYVLWIILKNLLINSPGQIQVVKWANLCQNLAFITCHLSSLIFFSNFNLHSKNCSTKWKYTTVGWILRRWHSSVGWD